jgi:excisionase family DNA binding protein
MTSRGPALGINPPMADIPPPPVDIPPLRPLLLTVHEAGILLGCDDAATWRLIKQGVIPARRLGSRVLVPREQLEELVRRLPPYPPAVIDEADP